MKDYVVIKEENLIRVNLSTYFREVILSQNEKNVIMQFQIRLRRIFIRFQNHFKIFIFSTLN